MSQQTSGDSFLDALSDVRQSGPPAHGIRLSGPPDPFLVALEDVKAEMTGQREPQETRSRFAQVVDTLSEPLIPQIATGARSISDWMTTPKLDDSRALAMTKGALGGLVEGAGNVVAGFTSPLGIAAAVSGVGAERAAVNGLVNAARALRGVEAASGAAFGARGLEQAVSAPTIAEKALGVAQAAAGALGVRGGVQGYQRIGSPVVEAARPVRGALPQGPTFIANESGTVARPGEAIPMTQAPDGSYVRSVPAEYARREPRGALPPGPRFVAAEGGPVADRAAGQLDPFIAALQETRRAPGPDVSRVESVPAAPLGYTAESGRVTPTQYSGDVNATAAPQVQLDPTVEYALRWIRQDMESIPFTKRTFNDAGNGRGGSLDVVGGAAGAPIYREIVGPEGREFIAAGRADVLRAIDNLLAGKLTKTGEYALNVARDLAEGKYDERRLMVTGPPDAEVGPALREHAAEMRPDDLSVRDFAETLTAEREKPIADAPFSLTSQAEESRAHQPSFADSAVREPGEEGFVNPQLAARVGLGTAGAAYGAATGEDTTDRLKRAAIFGAAGALAPSLLIRQGAGRAALTAGARQKIAPASPAGAVRFAERSPIPRAGEIPRDRLLEFPSLQKQPEGVREEIASILEQHGGFAEQRRGVQSIERTHALAERLDVPLRALRPGKALNAEELAAYRDAVASVMTKRQSLAEKMRAGQASGIDELEFSKLTDEATVLISNFRGAKAEAGRALNILRQKARVLQLGDGAFVQAALKAPGFEENTSRIAAAVLEAGGDPVKQLQLLRQYAGGTLFEKGQAVFYNSLLSGVKTHLRNTIGNAFNTLANLATPIGAAPLDAARAALRGTPREVFLREMPEAAVATFTALPKAFQDFTFTIRHGFTPVTVERAAAGVFDAPRVEVPGGALTNWPSRLLEASDVFFRSIARNQELYAGAYAAARRGRASGISARMANLIAGTGAESQALHARAEAFAARAVFQEDPGALINGILRLKNDPKIPLWARAVMTFTLPFIRTPANILRQGLEFSPVGIAMPAARQGSREGAQALGRAALGTMALAPLAYLAATGQVSGNGPTDPGERTALLEKGWQPNSIKIGDSWIRYQLFQPLSAPLAAMANAFERFKASDRSDKSADESLAAAVAGLSSSFLDQSFLAGLNGLLEAVSDPERNGPRFLSTFAQGLVPGSGLLRNISQAIDPVIRKPEGVAESVKTIIPGLSQTVPARQTRFGEDVVRQGGPIRRGFTVPEVSTEKVDPIADTLAELDVHPQVPRARLVRDGKVVPLTREQEHTIVKAIGKARRAGLEQVINGGRFTQLPEDAKRRLVDGALADATREVNRRALTRIGRGSPLTVDLLIAPAGQR